MNADNHQATGGESRYSRVRMGLSRLDVRQKYAQLQKQPLLALALIFSLAATIYWLVIASDRYVSESRVIVQQSDLGAVAAPDLASLISGSTTGNRADQLVMREYLLSRDVVRKLDAQLDLKGHYSSWRIDPFSRLAFATSDNDLYRYYLDRVTVEFDEYSGVLVVRSQAFDPKMAEAITSMMIDEGATFMNATANRLAGDQVEFMRNQVDGLEQRARKARQAVVTYQNRERIASPEAQAASITQLVGQLEARKSELEVQLASQSAFLVDDHPVLVELRRQIGAVERQIAQQNARLAGPSGGTLNSKMEQFAILEADAQFAEQLYRTALASLEQGQVESTRTIKSLSIIQQPNLPQEAELPNRVKKSLIFAIFAFLIAGVLQLLVMIIRDHRD